MQIDLKIRVPLLLRSFVYSVLEALCKYYEICGGAGAQAWDYERDRLWVRLPLKEMKYTIFLFYRSGIYSKRGVEFRHSTY